MAKTVFDNTPCGKGMGFVPRVPASTKQGKPTKSLEEFKRDIEEDDGQEIEKLLRRREGPSRR
jgi:hypothetical protein